MLLSDVANPRFRMIVDQRCLAMMGYGNCDARRAGKDNGVCEKWMSWFLGLYLNVCGLYCENPWYYRVCEDYNGIVSRRYCVMKWINLRILSVQSLEAHQRHAFFTWAIIIMLMPRTPASKVSDLNCWKNKSPSEMLLWWSFSHCVNLISALASFQNPSSNLLHKLFIGG